MRLEMCAKELLEALQDGEHLTYLGLWKLGRSPRWVAASGNSNAWPRMVLSSDDSRRFAQIREASSIKGALDFERFSSNPIFLFSRCISSAWRLMKLVAKRKCCSMSFSCMSLRCARLFSTASLSSSNSFCDPLKGISQFGLDRGLGVQQSCFMKLFKEDSSFEEPFQTWIDETFKAWEVCRTFHWRYRSPLMASSQLSEL